MGISGNPYPHFFRFSDLFSQKMFFRIIKGVMTGINIDSSVYFGEASTHLKHFYTDYMFKKTRYGTGKEFPYELRRFSYLTNLLYDLEVLE